MKKPIFDIKKHIKSDIWPRDEIRRQLDNLGTSPETRIDKCVIVFEHDENLAGVYLDTMSGREVLPSAPWRGKGHKNGFWTDDDSKLFAKYCSETYRFRPSTGAVDEALRSVTYDSRLERMANPWECYLDDLRGKWDGKTRFDDLPNRILGIPKGQYSWTIHQRWLVGAVQRAFEPGSKMDNVLTYFGPQGTGKSSFLSLLPPDDGLYADLDFSRFSKSKDIGEDLQGKAIIELGEMRGLRKVSQGDSKSGLTRQKDTYRDAYGKRSEDHLRGCVFACTVNPKSDGGILTDMTGNRRYWPIEVPGCGKTYEEIKKILDEERDQLWAEAVHYYDQGIKPVLPAEVQKQSDELCSRILDVDHSMVDQIIDYLSMSINRGKRPNGNEWIGQNGWFNIPITNQIDFWEKYKAMCKENDIGEARTYSCVEEIWNVCLGNTKKPTRQESQQISSLFSSGQIPGWTYDGQTRKGCGVYGRQRVFERVEQ